GGYGLWPSAKMVPPSESSSCAVACGLPPLVHWPMSPAPTKISVGRTGAGAASGTEGVSARLREDTGLGVLSPCGEPPHDRQTAARTIVAQVTTRVSRSTGGISVPLSNLW